MKNYKTSQSFTRLIHSDHQPPLAFAKGYHLRWTGGSRGGHQPPTTSGGLVDWCSPSPSANTKGGWRYRPPVHQRWLVVGGGDTKGGCVRRSKNEFYFE